MPTLAEFQLYHGMSTEMNSTVYYERKKSSSKH